MNVRELAALINKIKALGVVVETDAIRAAGDNDLAGLAYIANMAEGMPGYAARSFSEMVDLSDLIKGATPKVVFGSNRGAE